ncbi:N-formylglutamate amidohydrolase [Sphingosinicella sp. YJ22]|uniref:N-formylglutamate amidohydrolase n=1 Tax=Sphingosinicella sp. YJ22 TaxID=1104780 RepID=UPI00140CAB8C|nr:N-formylglutamate amidohydrolase [Sphingosinicella sp. YJ22]
MTDAPFYRIGPERPVLPVILSVPHAGRDYPPALIDAARVPVSVLEALEDRLVDRLIWRAVAAGATAFVATLPRAAIDLNRDEREIDPAMVAPPPPAHALLPTARTRGGLGLVPARLAGAGALWRGRISREELKRRVETVHRPFHGALASALAAAKQQFGAAILLDCHSMPPRPQGEAKVIFGDRHGRTISPTLLEAALGATRALGFAAACNEPYAGGHVIERHGKPAAQVHALQLEVDRSAYLDPGLRDPGPGFDSVARLIAAVVGALNGAVIGPPTAIAAE